MVHGFRILDIMHLYRHLILPAFLFSTATAGFGLTLQELTERFKDLPTVAEADLPLMKNEQAKFQGLVKHQGLKAHTWVQFPFVENPGSFGIDPKGRVFVAEVNRFWQGVPDLRGANQLIREDFQSVTVEDRQRMYGAHVSEFPEGFFTKVADRIIRLEDRDGNGAADHRTLFSDHFHEPLDGLAFSVLAEDDAVYLTCIPNVWKMTDANDDGVADSHEAIVHGFGVRVSFIGHDLHGITRGPDGRLYFSVGDRGYHVTTEDGKVHAASGRGAIFRCESDGSGFEVFCVGLRNPQELAFDEFGNLFTFDNTGDIGDLARMVYALEGTDSGWDMSHQSAHQYRTVLDWEDFHPETSMWVQEKLFETFNEEQPQWVYPPASHVARGPSGATYLSGESLPEDLRGKFLLANYRGSSVGCTVLLVDVVKKGAGYVAKSEDVLVEGAGVSDVELGYDGKIYLCDFGGGWEVNTSGGIHVLTSKNEAQRAEGEKMAALFSAGLSGKTLVELVGLLDSSDKRMRQAAQFELVKRGDEGQAALVAVAEDVSKKVTTRLHGVWALDQIGRAGGEVSEALLKLSEDAEVEVRANAARVLGSLRIKEAKPRLLEMLIDDSARVRSLATIALSRVAERGDAVVINAYYKMAADMGAGEIDPALRHACLTGLYRVGTEEAAVAQEAAESRESRLMATLFLRSQASEELVRFLDDADPQIRDEAIRAIYDTAAMDGPAGDTVASLDVNLAELSPTLQRRIVAANYRRGGDANAVRLVQLAGMTQLDSAAREAALHALRLWEKRIVTDPVLGHYRPLPEGERTMAKLGSVIGEDLKQLLLSDLPAEFAALGLQLADETDVELEEATLRKLAAQTELDASVRIAALNSLVGSAGSAAVDVVTPLLDDANAQVAAVAMNHAFALNIDGVSDRARTAIANGPLQVARAGIAGLAKTNPASIGTYWKARETSKLRRELWLDLYLALQAAPEAADQELAAAFLAEDPSALHALSETGGEPRLGELVFRNQGACLQCHKIRGEGGIQGPDLTLVGERLTPDKLVESLVNPNAVIAEGYGLSTVTLSDGSAIMGRITKQTRKELKVIGLDGTLSQINPDKVATITPPMSAMPPMGLSLPPKDLRDLVAYLSSRTKANAKKEAADSKDASSHGEEGESEQAKITK